MQSRKNLLVKQAGYANMHTRVAKSDNAIVKKVFEKQTKSIKGYNKFETKLRKKFETTRQKYSWYNRKELAIELGTKITTTLIEEIPVVGTYAAQGFEVMVKQSSPGEMYDLGITYFKVADRLFGLLNDPEYRDTKSTLNVFLRGQLFLQMGDAIMAAIDDKGSEFMAGAHNHITANRARIRQSVEQALGSSDVKAILKGPQGIRKFSHKLYKKRKKIKKIIDKAEDYLDGFFDDEDEDEDIEDDED